MNSTITEIRPAATRFKVTIDFDAAEFAVFCRMLKYTRVIPEALAKADSSSGWTQVEREKLRQVLQNLKQQFAKYIFPTEESAGRRVSVSRELWPWFNIR